MTPVLYVTPDEGCAFIIGTITPIKVTISMVYKPGILFVLRREFSGEEGFFLAIVFRIRSVF